MFKRYMLRLILRLFIAAGVLYLYLFRRVLLLSVFSFKLFAPLTPLHLVWALLMLSMLWHLRPQSALSLAGRKQFPHNYQPPAQPANRLALLEYVQRVNIRAWRVMLVWLSGNAVFALLYLYDIIGPAELLLLSTAYFVGDLVCILLFCPFQSWLMKNRCCVTCRIFDWGHFMMYTPMLLIRSFFSWSLFFTACVVLLHWEITYARYPERFWPGGNAALSCANCSDKLCRIKKRRHSSAKLEN